MKWLSENPTLLYVLVICISIVLIVAILHGEDLSWIPSIIRGLLRLQP